MEWGVAPAGSAWQPNVGLQPSAAVPRPVFLSPQEALAQLQMLQNLDSSSSPTNPGAPPPHQQQAAGANSGGFIASPDGGSGADHRTSLSPAWPQAAGQFQQRRASGYGPIVGQLAMAGNNNAAVAHHPGPALPWNSIVGGVGEQRIVADVAKRNLSSAEVARALLAGIDTPPVYETDEAMVRLMAAFVLQTRGGMNAPETVMSSCTCAHI